MLSVKQTAAGDGPQHPAASLHRVLTDGTLPQGGGAENRRRPSPWLYQGDRGPNHHRLMGPLGYVPPTEFEANYRRQRAGQVATV